MQLISKGDTTMNVNKLTEKQKSLRYAISVDFDCMRDAEYTLQEALDWFKTDECAEVYDGDIVKGIYKPTNENFLEVVNEVCLYCKYDKKW